ncbi:cora-domain-containing protein [Annulohypoxylon truncatum]|uniref:cora-domain-containing protein n=1 Tax=Annulohypoxylon truncatum TaxID=327061 RepID=UPI002007F93F|nr:cora-domain-containing protein [Annulohypoxylon truncatum]KAI1212592.1 cora-domain-containing protein [Annulohypoxylon truncatum]
MTSLHPLVPSPRLLRFLRLQSESFSFFSWSHDSSKNLGQAARKVLCATRRPQKSPPRVDCTMDFSQNTSLQAGMLDLDLLIQSRGNQASRGVRQRNLPYFLPNIGLRYSSSTRPPTKCQSTWRDKLWGFGTKKEGKPLEPDDLPNDSDRGPDNNSMFNMRRQLSQKAALEPRLRCTEVDENGNAILVDGEFKKSELIARFGLLPRDLRKIDSSNLPHILVRPTAILLNLLHLKVLIKYNRVLLFDAYGSKASYPQSAFMYDLQGKLQQKVPGNGGLPYEFRALEAVLQSVTQELEADFEAVRDPVIRILSELEDDIDRHKLRILLVLSKRVSTFEQKAKLVRDAIEELLEADDDLADMYLTEKTHEIHRELDDHTEVEMLLESYHKLCDEIVQEAQNLVSSIRNTEEIIRAILDANRNSLMLLDLKFSVGTLGLAMGTFIAGLYGMNLENFIEETHWGFAAVTGASILFSLWVCKYGLAKLRKVQRVKMQTDSIKGSDNGYHWFHDEGNVGLLDPRNREMLRRLNMKKQEAEKKKIWW